MDDVTRQRRDKMRARVKADLARRGISSADLAGMEREARIDDDAVTGWTWTVYLTGDRVALVYEHDNRDGAPLVCNGKEVPTWQPAN